MIFIIATYPGLDGVRLSKPGHFGNMPFASDADADAFAVAEARRAHQQARVERKRYVRHLSTVES